MNHGMGEQKENDNQNDNPNECQISGRDGFLPVPEASFESVVIIVSW